MVNISHCEFLQQLNSGMVAIVANNRLRSSLKQECFNLQTEINSSAVKIFNLSAFCQQTLEQAVLIGTLPTSVLPAKILTLLEQVIIFAGIIKQTETSPLLSYQEIANQAVVANDLLQNYCLDTSINNSYFHSLEFARFLIWQTKYHKYCQQNNFIDQTGLLVVFAQNIEVIKLPKKILIAGFELLTPLQQQIFSQVELLQLQPDRHCQTTEKIACADFTAEITAATIWAQSISKQQPKAKIGIIVPQFELHYYQLKSTVKSILYPEQADLQLNNYFPIHNLSLGQPLLNYEIIATAITWVEILHQFDLIDYQIISKLLLSPHWISELDDIKSRSEFDWQFRQQTSSKLTIKQWLNLLHDFKTEATWRQQLIKICEGSLNLIHTKQNLSEWVKYFFNVWQQIGLGKSPTTIINNQLLQALVTATKTLTHMELIIGNCTANDAVQLLKTICQQQIFQFSTRHAAPIQIMGLLEANSLQFDFVWLLSVNDNVVPALARPNAILPLELQIAHQMSKANATQELEFAQKIINKLQNSTYKIIFSYSTTDADGIIILPSGLIKNIPNSKLVLPETQFIPSTIKQETFTETAGIALNYGKTKHQLKRALRFFKAQAICPLMAYAEFRLMAVDLPIPEDDFSPLVRGNILHKILELVIRQPKPNYQSIVSQEINHFAKTNNIKPKMMLLEITRVTNMVKDWLDNIEAKRTPDFTIDSLEQQFEAEFQDFKFIVRLDRVDNISGQKLLIDYKISNSVSNGGWFDERLTEPQLPMYATTLDSMVCGIAFVQLTPNGNKFLATTNTSLMANKSFKQMSDTQWQDILQMWQQKLQILASEIASGKAYYLANSVVAKSAAAGFCRIYEDK